MLNAFDIIVSNIVMEVPMSSLQMKSKGSVDRNSLRQLNSSSNKALSASNILTLNRVTSNNTSMPNTAATISQVRTASPATNQNRPLQQTAIPSHNPLTMQASAPSVASSIVNMPIPALNKPIQKGQKALLFNNQEAPILKACLGWNVSSMQCDIDVSAFLLGDNDKVIGDAWFVFYGQPESPDRSTLLLTNTKDYREAITINFKALNPAVKKIVFVLTIHEALQKHLNFSMVKDAYIRLIDERTQTELTSFKMTDYYSNVISMMIGEIYAHNNTWKFNAIGNGVAKDLAGLCSLYGVQVDD